MLKSECYFWVWPYLINQNKPYTEIDPNDIELIESIGAGSYGSGIFSILSLGIVCVYHWPLHKLKIKLSFQSKMEVEEYRSGG